MQMDEGGDVLGETAAAVARAGEEELETDALVVADAAADVVDVGLQFFAEVGHLVDEADLGGEHRVGDVLRHLRGFRRHGEERPLGARRGVQFLKQFSGPVGADADDHAVRLHEVVEGGLP
ncbi:MAG: hypothetical protein U0793_22200 [Gemmataceae bacterium]